MRRCCQNDLPPVHYGDDGFPEVFVDPKLPDWDSIVFRRWGSGGTGQFHTFVDDYRQETFWRNWQESIIPYCLNTTCWPTNCGEVNQK